jgi:hypothetical protein
MTMAMRHLALVPCLVGLVLALGATGCARLTARTEPPPPPLDVPAPPPRVVEAVDTERPTAGTLVDAPASGAPSSRRPPPARVEPSPKPEPPKPAEPTPPVVETAPPSDPPRPAPTLQTTPPERQGAVELEIRAALGRAHRDLGKIDYRRLSQEAQKQYDQAKRFATQAEDALQNRNLPLAQQFAQNAANMAAQLGGR